MEEQQGGDARIELISPSIKVLGDPCQQIGQAVSREMISNFVLRP